MRQGRARSGCRCGMGEPSLGTDVAGVSPVPMQIRQRRAQSRCRCGPDEQVLVRCGSGVPLPTTRAARGATVPAPARPPTVCVSLTSHRVLLRCRTRHGIGRHDCCAVSCAWNAGASIRVARGTAPACNGTLRDWAPVEVNTRHARSRTDAVSGARPVSGSDARLDATSQRRDARKRLGFVGSLDGAHCIWLHVGRCTCCMHIGAMRACLEALRSTMHASDGGLGQQSVGEADGHAQRVLVRREVVREQQRHRRPVDTEPCRIACGAGHRATWPEWAE